MKWRYYAIARPNYGRGEDDPRFQRAWVIECKAGWGSAWENRATVDTEAQAIQYITDYKTAKGERGYVYPGPASTAPEEPYSAGYIRDRINSLWKGIHAHSARIDMLEKDGTTRSEILVDHERRLAMLEAAAADATKARRRRK